VHKNNVTKRELFAATDSETRIVVGPLPNIADPLRAIPPQATQAAVRMHRTPKTFAPGRAQYRVVVGTFWARVPANSLEAAMKHRVS
jgi:hypothetical protein